MGGDEEKRDNPPNDQDVENESTLDLRQRQDISEVLKKHAKQVDRAKVVTSLTLEFCPRLEDSDLELLEHFPNLTHLNLNGCTTLTDLAAYWVSIYCKKLTTLSLYWVPKISDEGIGYLADMPCEFTELNLSGVKHATDKAIINLVQRVGGGLTKLNLTRMERLTCASLTAIAQHCPLLRELNLYACSNFKAEGVANLARGCPLLEVLDLTGSPLLYDPGMEGFTQIPASPSPSTPQSQSPVSPVSPAAATSPSPSTAASASTSASTSTSAPAPAPAPTTPSSLRSLNLTWCIKLTDASLHALAASAPELRFLSIHGNQLVTDEGLEALRACSRLEVIDVNGCKLITDRSAQRLHGLFPNLKTIVSL